MKHLVNLPVPNSVNAFFHQFALPDFAVISNKVVWTTALTIAVVGSLETLLSLEAADRLDPYKRISSSDRELRAQGVGNIVAGLIGGIPVTSVVVRTAANVEAGGRTRLSTVIHGLLLLASVILLPGILRLTPLASLATILIMVGYKLTKPTLYRATFRQGWDQFIPFVITTAAVVFLDLLSGVLVGMAFGVFFVIRTNHHDAITVVSLRLQLSVPLHQGRQFRQQERVPQEAAPVTRRFETPGRREPRSFHRSRHPGDPRRLPANGAAQKYRDRGQALGELPTIEVGAP